MGDFIDWVFPDISQHVAHAVENAKHDYWFKEKAILTSRNEVAADINKASLDRLDPNTELSANSSDSSVDPEHDDTQFTERVSEQLAA